MRKLLLFHLIFSVLNFSLSAQNISDYFQQIRDNEAELTAFISQMPKGGDLHNHYSGAVYAESYIDWVIEQDFWIDTQTLAVARDAKDSGTWARFSVLSNQGKLDLYKQKLLQLWSTKDYYQTQIAPEQHFFNTFPAFSAASNINYDRGLLELKNRAIAENVSYIELMLSRVNFPPKKIDSADYYNILLGQIQSRHDSLKLRSVLGSLYDRVMEVPIRDSVNSFIRFVQSLHESLHIDTINFTMRYQTYIARTADPVTTFKNLVASFEAANTDSLIVGVNIVAPEDNPVSMRDYWLHMQMFAFCHRKYKSVKYSMHAGELA
ncbi:MAG TPA: hypothetical protein VEV83_14855, partial [Parafilimonas sp.]|nr:hypothetical protein [Parafilimonas sp.]